MSKKFQQIKQKPKKIKANIEKWLELAIKIAKSNKRPLLSKIWSAITRKNQRDFEKDSCKALIQRMDNSKITFEEAQQIAINASATLQDVRKDLPKVLLYLFGGGILLLISLVFFIIHLPKSLDINLWLSNMPFIFWLIMICINGFLFYLGMSKRALFDDKLIPNALLAQAGTAYASCKAPGRGGSLFEAYQYLDTIREKNKESFQNQLPFGKKKSK